MPTRIEAENQIRTLSMRALQIVENPELTWPQKKLQLDGDGTATNPGIEGDLKKWQSELEDIIAVDERKKRYEDAGTEYKDGHGSGHRDDPAVGDNTIGDQFVKSVQYKTLKDRGFSGKWTSGDIEIKTTLTEGTAGSPGGGYQVAAQPNVLPGILDIRFAPLTVADLFPSGTTDSPLIRYLVEQALTNAAAAVAEGNLKPESAMSFTKQDETLHKLATFLPVTDEMLEDWAQARSYINARLALFVKQQEESQLLSGDGSGANLVGLLNRSGLATTVVKGTAPSAAGDNAMDAIYRQITRIRMTSFLEPDAIVIEPTAWESIVLAKATGTGNYFANGPFADTQAQTLWSKRVVVTAALAANTALVGAFAQAAQIFRKGGLVVEASNSHADFFQRNMTAIRAEERLALAVYRPGAFGRVTNL